MGRIAEAWRNVGSSSKARSRFPDDALALNLEPLHGYCNCRRTSSLVSRSGEQRSNDVVAQFLDELSAEEREVSDELARDTRGIAVRVALTELDWNLYNFFRRADLTDKHRELEELSALGTPRLVSLSLRNHPAFTVPTITISRKNPYMMPVLELIGRLGFIEQGRRAAARVRSGEGYIARQENGSYEFVLHVDPEDRAVHEHLIEEHFRKEHRRLRTSMFESAEGQRVMRSVREALDENVFVFAGRFMGYESDPLLDEHFFQLAWFDLTGTDGYDAFNENRKFGGIPFLKFLLAVSIFNSFSLKHEAFAEALVRKRAEILLEDILTHTAPLENVVSNLHEAMNVFGLGFQNYKVTSIEEARQIYEVVALTRRNVDLMDRAFAPIPCLVEFSDASVICVGSGRYKQMEFVLSSLRRSFPRDFDRHQKLREASMQNALENLLGDAFAGLEFRRNVNLRTGGRTLTDIDLAVVDLHHGELLLVQIKVQDHPGRNPQIKKAKSERFRAEAIRWLGAVDQWLESSNERVLRASFRIPRQTRIAKIRKLVVARSHAWSLRGEPLDDNTIYCSWIQLLNAVMVMELRQGDFRTLGGLFAILRRHVVEAFPCHRQSTEPLEYVLKHLKFSISERSDRPPY
jgi:hypothetical protein